MSRAPRSRTRTGRVPTRPRLTVFGVNGALVIGLLLSVGPIVWMFLTAFKPEGEIRRFPPTWWPQTWTLENFRTLFTVMDFPQHFFNSALVAVTVTVGNLLFCSMVGYALAKLDFPGRGALFVVVMATLMIPGMVTFVPLFVLVSTLGLTNSYLALILPFLASPFGVFLMRQFIGELPDELLDAAQVDGAGQFRTFFQVVIPQCRPALATLGILTFLGSWNNFLWPLVAVQSADKYTLPVALALYSTGQNTVRYGLLIAGAAVIVVPVVAVFLVLQRHIVQGIATTGLK